MLKILAIGDVFGRPGREVIKKFISQIVSNNSIDLIIANVENATNGKGISEKHYNELKRSGINIMTSGNHIFSLRETEEYISRVSDLLRPLNFSYHPGLGTTIVNIKGKKIRVTNLIGQDFMTCKSENPYIYLDKIIEKEKDDVDFKSDLHLIDFHAESTAEKNIFALNYDGLITAIWGTHTHVQTSDERILKKGTAFISDIGMTGPFDGVIGSDPESIIRKSKYNLPTKITPYYNCEFKQINGIILEINDQNKVISIERLKKIY